jgi:hypothetical protein
MVDVLSAYENNIKLTWDTERFEKDQEITAEQTGFLYISQEGILHLLLKK